jgi:hypothetical protein
MQAAELLASAFPPFFSDAELAEMLIMTVPWTRAHAEEIPGFQRLGAYYRFRSGAVEQWLGSLDRL